MKSKAPDLTLPLITWKWPCIEETLSALPQFDTPLPAEQTEQFWNRLSGSLSLSVDEKMQVIDAVPGLSATQVSELIEVWDDELKKFQKLLSKEFSIVSKLIGEMAIGWLIIWERLKLKKDDQKVDVTKQFVDIYYSGGTISEFKSYGRNSYFWVGYISVMNKHGYTGTINRVLDILEGTLNDSNLGVPICVNAESKEEPSHH